MVFGQRPAVADVAHAATFGEHGGTLPRVRVRITRSLGMAIASLLLLGGGISQLSSLSGPSLRPGGGLRQGSAHDGLAALPLQARGQIAGTLAAGDSAYQIRAAGSGLWAANAEQGLHVRFERSGVELGSGAATLSVGLPVIGSGPASRLDEEPPRRKANRVSYAGSDVTAWYVNSELGLEQGFTVEHATAAAPREPLTLSMSLGGDTRGALAPDHKSVTFMRGHAAALRYTGLVTTDARGRLLRSSIELGRGRLVIHVDAARARYPLTVDPIIQQGEKLTGGGEGGNGELGTSVALSADGDTAVVGGAFDEEGVGAAWIFTRADGVWVQQGGKLVGDCTSGCSGSNGTGESGKGDFGASVAVSGDGDTVMVGAPADAGYVGAVWVFTRSAGTWAQQGVKLAAECNPCSGGGAAGEVGDGSFGAHVSLSSEGTTALVGAPSDSGETGAAWVLVRSGGVWTQQGEKLSVSGYREFGASGALSADGNTALVGAPRQRGGENLGAAWVFTRSGETWAQQGEKLVGDCTSGCGGPEGTGESGDGEFGFAVALSADGNTALIGAREDHRLFRRRVGLHALRRNLGAAGRKARWRLHERLRRERRDRRVRRRRTRSQRRALCGRQHGADRSAGRQRPRGGRLDVHALR